MGKLLQDAIINNLSSLIMAVVQGAMAQQMIDAREKQLETSKEEGSKMSKAIAKGEGDSPDGERASKLSGLEARAMDAQFTNAQAQDMAAMNGLISSLIQNAGQTVANTIKAAFDVKDKLEVRKRIWPNEGISKERMPAGNQGA